MQLGCLVSGKRSDGAYCHPWRHANRCPVTCDHGGILLTDTRRAASVVGTGAPSWPVDKGAKSGFRGDLGSWAA